jgi:putative serine protease PepD
MQPSKILATGVAVGLALAGGGVLAHELDNGSSSSANSSTPAAAAARPVANDTTKASTVYDGAKDAVAYIQSNTPYGQATGSGFVVSSDGYVVTNEHVIDGAGSIQVKIGTGSKTYTAQVVGSDASRDLALLKVDASGLPTLSLADSGSVQVGDATYAIGNPYGLDDTLTTGIVSALQRDIQSPNGSTISGAIQTDAALNPGNSGGPLLDSSGKVIGVNAQIATGGNGSEGNVGIGFAIPSNTVKSFIDEAKAGKLSTSTQTQSQAQGLEQQQQQQQVEPEPTPWGFGIG